MGVVQPDIIRAIRHRGAGMGNGQGVHAQRPKQRSEITRMIFYIILK
eukprot:CAMPEP_0172568240 /NCGR_PEP_ID=MMETSP1067-20121228/119128_1 /TAXON_ID=265564 ORGANISM="Thalassiosira punctigera, Strain Tpunct2005C2" /NCGR_SAMPLE_ID=MMETSP1067 /ASSEMBLY_ACC=CAM_ASM_000444 /LENGTH=46 /DNA_ID= /DNA_START= /DNA_END= /DNA_ORIENTATION=